MMNHFSGDWDDAMTWRPAGTRRRGSRVRGSVFLATGGSLAIAWGTAVAQKGAGEVSHPRAGQCLPLRHVWKSWRR